jgi:preprotein translocase subunit Sec63
LSSVNASTQTAGQSISAALRRLDPIEALGIDPKSGDGEIKVYIPMKYHFASKN